MRFGARPDDALLFGRTKDRGMWLERRAPGAPSKRLRVPLPADCKTRSLHSITRMTGLDAGELVLVRRPRARGP